MKSPSVIGIAIVLSLVTSDCFATGSSDQGMVFFKQAKYAAAASAFAKSYASSHSATDCYYTALSYHYDRKSDLARKFYQETVQRFPNSREAALAQQALASTRPTTAAKITPFSTSRDNVATSAPATAPASDDPVSDLLAKAEAADRANQQSTADAYYSDAIRHAEKLGQNNPKLLQAITQSADYFAKHQRTDKALAAYDRARYILRIRHGEDSLQCGNNSLAIARMFKSVDNVDDAKSHYYQAIDTYTNALRGAEGRSNNTATQQRAALADTLDELADFLYNLTFSTRGYGNVEVKSQHTTELEVRQLRARAQQVRAGN